MRLLKMKLILFAVLIFLTGSSAHAGLNLDGLAESDVLHVQELLGKLAPLIKERDTKENLSTLTFQELYAPINDDDQKFLKQFESLDAQAVGVKIPFRGIATGEEELTVIKEQMVKVK